MLETARRWTRPYSSVQWAWVRALGLDPSEEWGDGESRARRRRPRKRDVLKAMRQRHGVRGL